MTDLSLAIEALLFAKTEPLSRKRLAEFLKADPDELETALLVLKEKLAGRGIRLLEKGEEVMLGTAPEASGLVERMLKEEITRELGRAGLETIAIVLYQGPVTKSEIDFIRGVNSQYILRSLLIRGLVERIPNPGGRAAFYQSTFDLLRYLGVTTVSELPDYDSVKTSLNNFKVSTEKESAEEPIGGGEDNLKESQKENAD